MNHYCEDNKWLAVQDGNGVIFSIRKGEKGEKGGVFFFLGSNVYKSSSILSPAKNAKYFNESDEKTLATLSIRALSRLAQCLDAESNINERVLEKKHSEKMQ